MSTFSQVDLSALPVPDVVEALDYEALLSALLAKLRELWPEFTALFESDPAIKLMELMAYLEVLLRQRVNDAARAVMLPTAQGADLDNIVALMGVSRAVVDAGDPDARPPRPVVMENDERLRRRAQLALEAKTAAGTKGRYLFHVLEADASIGDAAISAHDPSPGDVTISLLSSDPDDWTPSADAIDAVRARVNAEDVRQLCDTLFVYPAEMVDYQIEATIYYLPGAGTEIAKAVSAERLNELVALRRLGRDVAPSEIIAALHVEGVQRVALTSPAGPISIGPKQAARCTSITLTDGGVNE